MPDEPTVEFASRYRSEDERFFRRHREARPIAETSRVLIPRRAVAELLAGGG